MDSAAMLKSYCESVLKIQHKYGWIMDNYVLDFFTKDLWQRLPCKWTNVLHELKPNEIAYYLLEMSAQKDAHNSEKPTLRKVWPLELLAFLAVCHSLDLKNQPWMNTKKINTQCSQQHEILGRSCIQETTTLGHADCPVEKETNAEGEELRNAPNEITCSQQSESLSQNVKLSHAFRCNIKPKKQHEIEVLSKVICEQAKKLQCWNIVDVGAGLGHLSRLLSYGCFLHVVTIEGDGCHKTGAEKLDRKLVNHLQKQQAAQEQTNSSVQLANGSLIHVTHHISADISVEEFANVVSEAFDKMKQLPNEDGVSNTASKSLHSKGSCENFIIVGLHTCGDLASTLLRVFSQCKHAVGIVTVGCCYMKLSHEKSKFEQTLTKKDQQDIDARSDLKVFGYPMSEYLKSIPYHQQSYNGLEAACHALSQYHKKLLEISPTLKLHYYRALLELLLQQKNPNCGRRQIRTLRPKKAAKMTFEEYARSACQILQIEEGCPTSEDIRHAEELHQGKEYDVVVFYVLRLLLAPLIEGLILVDRLLFIKENDPGVDARISLLFDSNCSPRNIAIIATKAYGLMK